MPQEKMPMTSAWILGWSLAMMSCTSSTGSWLVPQPRENVWVTLAHSLGQDNFCLSSGAAGNPQSSCLMGVPWSWQECMQVRQKPSSHSSLVNLTRDLGRWMLQQSHAPTEPQELALLGSGKRSLCLTFAPLHHWLEQREPTPVELALKNSGDPSPVRSEIYKDWCVGVKNILVASAWRARQLPKGLFLICGDHAWAGIPSHPLGGPCTIGKFFS